ADFPIDMDERLTGFGIQSLPWNGVDHISRFPEDIWLCGEIGSERRIRNYRKMSYPITGIIHQHSVIPNNFSQFQMTSNSTIHPFGTYSGIIFAIIGPYPHRGIYDKVTQQVLGVLLINLNAAT